MSRAWTQQERTLQRDVAGIMRIAILARRASAERDRTRELMASAMDAIEHALNRCKPHFPSKA